METHGYSIDPMRSDATDTCHGACGDGCPQCRGIAEVNFRPVDIRTQYFLGGADPKLDPSPAMGDERFIRNADGSGIRK